MNHSHFDTSITYARRADLHDPLGKFRKQFFFPEPGTIYLDGNSLGRLPHRTREILNHHIEHQWGKRLIRSWNEGWFDLPEKLGARLAPIIGAEEDEVIVGDSTSLNLYKAAWAAVKHNKGRTRIVSDDLNFPTDLYVLQGITRHLGKEFELVLARSSDGVSLKTEDLEKVVDDNTALVVLSHVTFKSAYMHDMETITRLVHSHGALMLWDLSHAAGAVPVALTKSDADLAVGCTYKYLNGGPGSPAYIYVKKALQNDLESPVWGWFGDDKPFAFNLDYKPAEGIKRFLVGSPPILSMAAIEPGLDMILKAGMSNIRKKSIRQTEYLLYLIEHLLAPLGFSTGSPVDPEQRGSHISVRHPEAFRICQALILPENSSHKIIPDFREPDNIRLGIAPLYNSYEDIFQAVNRIGQIVTDKIYQKYSGQRAGVT